MSDVMAAVSLEDTVTGMTSGDYKECFKAEYAQTKIRYENLKHFGNRIEAAQMTGVKPPKHDSPLHLLREQQQYMGMYLSVLEKRAIIEEITL